MSMLYTEDKGIEFEYLKSITRLAWLPGKQKGVGQRGRNQTVNYASPNFLSHPTVLYGFIST